MAAFYSFTRFLIWFALLFGALVGVLRATVLRWVWLPDAKADPVFSTSVMPSLEGGDLILTYRLGDPSFGDLVLCPEPAAPKRFIIGRIFGEPGDRVRIVDSKPEVNGDTFVFERGCDPPRFHYVHQETGEEIEQQCSMEAVAAGLHKVGTADGHKVIPTDRQYVVPEGSWFLMSDNRLYPYDSRDYGYVPQATCKERVFARVVSAKGWTDVEKRLSFIP
jgi:signal peptidase I